MFILVTKLTDQTKLTPSMKDFIASKMVARDWRTIVSSHLDGEEERIEKWDRLYDQSFEVIRKLVQTKNIKFWYQMKEVFITINKGILDDFKNKFEHNRTG